MNRTLRADRDHTVEFPRAHRAPDLWRHLAAIGWIAALLFSWTPAACRGRSPHGGCAEPACGCAEPACGCAEPACGCAEPSCACDGSDPYHGLFGHGGHESRGTLFQWSYGTSFEGGPDLEEPLVTDRPDFTEASVTVGRGVLQIEGGFTYIFNDDDGQAVRHLSFPETLFRYGILADWLELRLAKNFGSQEDPVERNTGAEDLYLGLKIGLTPQEGILPEMALVPQTTVPTGHSAFTADEVLPGCNWLYGWDINDFLATGGSTQFNRTIDEGTDAAYTEWAQSWTINYTLSDRLGAYTEWFAFFPHSADTARPQHYFDGGFVFLVTDDIQWDVRAGVGLNHAADDYFVGTGLSIRLK